jgi:hypothetical protein
MQSFPFDFSSPLSLPLRVFGIGRETAVVTVDDDVVEARFGAWKLRTPLDNIASVAVTGALNPLTALGLRLSVRDWGVTFGTSLRHGVCLTFHEPVASVVPGLPVRHRGLTVTVEDPDALAQHLVERAGAAVDRGTVDDALVHRVEEREQAAAEAEAAEAAAERRARQRLAERRREEREAEEKAADRRDKARMRRAGRRAAQQTPATGSRTTTKRAARNTAARKSAAVTTTATKAPATKRPATRTPATRAPGASNTAKRTAKKVAQPVS